MAMATTKANQEETEVDWSDLPADLLESISKKLPDIVDLIYFRCVCKRWRAATSISDLPSQIPWLVANTDYDQSNGEYLRFYCLLSGKVRTIRCPDQSRGKRLQGPSRAYLYSVFQFEEDDRKHSLLNPLTGDDVTIPFPKCSTQICMGPDPIGNDHIAFLFHGKVDRPSAIGFYRLCHREWYYTDSLRFSWPRGQACLKGKYYRHESETGATVVLDIASGSSFLIPPPESQTYDPYLRVRYAESAGKILRMVNTNDFNLEVSSFSFHIYQLNVECENNKSRWVKISSIGDQMLFLDYSTGISVTASESTG